MTFQPTIEQNAITAAVQNTTRNLAVKARAGAAKSTTILLIAEALPAVSILVLAFNAKIVKDIQPKLPPNAEAKTINALGHRAWGAFLGKNIKLNDSKCREELRDRIKALPQTEQEEAWESFSDMLKAISEAKTEGYLPAGTHPMAKPLVSDRSFYDLLDIETSDLFRDLVDETLSSSFRKALKGEIDFNDQILCPAIMSVSFDRYDLVMIDEAQDLSPINHVILRKLVGKRRLIAVGDPCQAIYGFRGASEKSMDELIEQFDMQELFLTICFRSAESVVKNARWRAPDMQWRPGAPIGIVKTLLSWGPETLRDGDAIICRNNAPIFGQALSLIRAGLYPEILGTDSMQYITGIMKKLGKPSTPIAEAKLALQEWEEKARKKYKSGKKIDDIIATLHYFFAEAETLGNVIDSFQRVLNATGKIKLMTGHRSKGLEFDRVFFLDKFLLGDEGQDLNLRYVIETRAREELYYVERKGWSA